MSERERRIVSRLRLDAEDNARPIRQGQTPVDPLCCPAYPGHARGRRFPVGAAGIRQFLPLFKPFFGRPWKSPAEADGEAAILLLSGDAASQMLLVGNGHTLGPPGGVVAFSLCAYQGLGFFRKPGVVF